MTNRVVGQTRKRVTGKLKVTGAAKYAAEFAIENVAHGFLTTSTIAKGRIIDINTKKAQALPGVIAIITHQNAPQLAFEPVPQTAWVNPGEIGEYPHTLHSDRIYFYGQPVAIAIAETLEQAELAASLIRVEYQEESANFDVERIIEADRLVPFPDRPDQTRGNPEAAYKSAEVSIDANYIVPVEHHNPIEPHATIALWSVNKLTVYDKTQWVSSVRQQLSSAFGLPLENVNVVSPFVGGAFGNALRVWQNTFITSMAASVVNRPVKLVLSRKQNFSITGHRPYTWQRVALGAKQDGTLTSIIHEAIGETATFELFAENVLDATRLLYTCPNVQTKYRLAEVDISAPTPMRGPGDAQGSFALECALDELAYKLNIDPVELRLINYAERDPESNLPWSSKALKECYQQGAKRIGWNKRNPQPRSMSKSGLLIGYGMASATYPMNWRESVARVKILQDGTAIVQSAASDMGPGTYTAMTIVASEALGIPSDRIAFELGNTNFPNAAVHGGSTTVTSVGLAVKAACEEVRLQALALAQQNGLVADRKLKTSQQNGNRETSYAEILTQAKQKSIEAEATSKPKEESPYSMHSFGATFVEVKIDELLGNINVTRVVTAIDVGRIVNSKTAKSQIIGGVVGGIGMALLEHTHQDTRYGNYVNANLGEYLVPVNADIGNIEAIFCGEPDYNANPLGARGIGEISIVGIAPAIANAVCHATGRRVRDLPITLNKLL